MSPNIKKEYISKLNTIEVKENKKEELILTQKKTKPKKNNEEICTPKKLGRKKKIPMKLDAIINIQMTI